MAERLLITGASGFMGSNFSIEARQKFDVIGVHRSHPVPVSGIKAQVANLCDKTQVQKVFSEVRPAFVIHCAAATEIDALESERAVSLKYNSEMAAHIARAAAEAGSYLIHISTDSVFDGIAGHYHEESMPNPVNEYARSKLAGEKAVYAENADAAIIRTNIFGWSYQDSQTLAEWFLKQLRKGNTPRGFTDIFFSPLLVNSLFQILVRFMDQRLSGLFHVPGANCISKYEFGRMLASRFGYNPSLVQPYSSDEFIFRAKRPKNTCLDGSKVCRALGIELPPIDEELNSLRELLTTEPYRRWLETT